MKQIKTVIEPINRIFQFDNEINKLLANGWELKKREIIDTKGELSEAFNAAVVRLLYAELEKLENDFEEITL